MIDESLAGADCVVLACPLTPQTNGLIGRDQIDRMKPGVAVDQYRSRRRDR